MQVDFPEFLDDELAVDLISKLLRTDPNKRYGCLRNGVDDIKNHPWFHSIQWDTLTKKSIPKELIPWIPPLRDDLDASNFDRYDEGEEVEPYNNAEEDVFKDF